MPSPGPSRLSTWGNGAYRDVPHHLDGQGKVGGPWAGHLGRSCRSELCASPGKPGAFCLLQVHTQRSHGGFVHSGTAALANGLPDQVLLQPEALPAPAIQGVSSQLTFLGENGLRGKSAPCDSSQGGPREGKEEGEEAVSDTDHHSKLWIKGKVRTSESLGAHSALPPSASRGPGCQERVLSRNHGELTPSCLPVPASWASRGPLCSEGRQEDRALTGTGSEMAATQCGAGRDSTPAGSHSGR